MNLYIAYLILIISVISGLYLVNKHGAKIKLNDINFASWYYLIEFLLMGVLSVFIIKRISDHNWALSYIPKESFPLIEVIYTCAWCAIAIPIGFILANLLLKKLNFNHDYNQFKTKDISENRTFNFINYIFIFSSISYLFFIIYKIGYIPQLKALSLSSEEIRLLRGQLTHHFPSNNYFKEFIGFNLSYLSLFFNISEFIRERSSKNFILLSLTGSVAITFITLTLTKSGIALLIIGVMITVSLSLKNINMKYIATGIISTLLFLTFAFSFFNNIKITNAFNAVVSRIIYSQSYGNYLSLYIYPDIKEHIGFSSISKLIQPFGFEYREKSSREIMKLIAEEEVKKGTAGFVVSTFFAEAWANFGLIGIIFSPLFVGFIIKFLLGTIMTQGKNPLTISLITLISYRMGINQGFNQIIFPRYLILTLSTIILLKIILDKSKFFKNSSY